MENIISGVAPKIGFDLEEDKEIFHILLSDGTESKSSFLYCKCRMKEDKKLELYKVETNPTYEMIKNILRVDKNLDLRLALQTKRILTSLTDDEMHSIGNIINSAIIDPEVKGGLRWPYASIEVYLKLKRLVSDLQEEKVGTDSIFEMFKDNLKMIWDHFFCCDQYFP
ncbi:hypothetical protein QYF36_020512 [Acer negundo]|nr:hypothetical protein QYF36_020512 [Acer negundo]